MIYSFLITLIPRAKPHSSEGKNKNKKKNTSQPEPTVSSPHFLSHILTMVHVVISKALRRVSSLLPRVKQLDEYPWNNPSSIQLHNMTILPKPGYAVTSGTPVNWSMLSFHYPFQSPFYYLFTAGR